MNKLTFGKYTHSKEHPAVFPAELVQRVIQYYSFEGDVVLDPFAGTGTVGKVATMLGRKFALVEMDPEYIKLILRNAESWLGSDAAAINCIGCEEIEGGKTLF